MGLYSIATNEFSCATGGKTALQLATGASNRARLVEFGISFQGTSAADAPALVQLLRQTTAGTTTSVTPVKLDAADVAAESTAGKNATAEPTPSDVLLNFYLTPNGGAWAQQFPLGREPIMAASTYLGILVTTAATVDTSAYMIFEEF